MKKALLLLCFLVPTTRAAHAEFTRHVLARNTSDASSEIVYYISQPTHKNYSLVVLCEGSYSATESISSVLDLHKLFLPILKNCNVGLLTVEKLGVNDNAVNKNIFFTHNSISQRVKDHETVLRSLTQRNLPGWDGTFIFIGGSEGGDVASSLMLTFSKQTIASIIFAGIGLHSKQDEIWEGLQHMRKYGSWLERLYVWWKNLPKTRADFDAQVMQILQDPDPTKWWFGQTYHYWADAFTRTRETSLPEFYNLPTPLFIAVGTADSLINSTDALVERMKEHNMQVTYRRLEGIPHGLSKHCPTIFDQAAAWLQKVICKK
ncbi:alpha/beta hydrolase fold domain-containing protein [Candidatus Babeliales bacterium]|nr:alpha/beta hydrolase fold domain-containing protein [Candidatus Babeliales bacterium]